MRARTASRGLSTGLLGCAALAAVYTLSSLGGCSDSGEADTYAPPAVTVASTDASSGSTSSSTGGMGGTGGAGPCLTGTPAASYFSVETSDLCVVARYDAAALDLSAPYASPTWGSHGGPLTTAPTQMGTTANLAIARWSVSGSTLTKAETTSALSPVTNPAFFTGELLELPFGTSFIGWQGTDFMNDGGAFLTSDTTQQKAFTALGVFSFGFVGPSADNYVRVVYSGLSALDGPTTPSAALYAADLHSDGSFVVPSAAIATWGTASGPVAADAAGNVIAVQSSGPSQEMRGFASQLIKPLATPTAGKTLLTTTGFGSELAAVAPTATLPGLALLQPQVGAGVGQDVLLVRYTSDGTTLAETGASVPLLKLAVAGTNLTLMTDPDGRVWVGAKNTDGGATGTVFFVLDRP